MTFLLLSISITQASFYSLIIPGSGDILLGNKSRGKNFLIAEAGIWSGYFFYEWQGRQTQNSYIEFAYLRGSANPNNDNEDYLDAMERYMTGEEYNEYVKEMARSLYPDTTDPGVLAQRKEFIKENSIDDNSLWHWQSDKDFQRYIELRKRQRAYLNTALNIASLAIINRIASFVATSIFSRDVSVEVRRNGVNLTWRF